MPSPSKNLIKFVHSFLNTPATKQEKTEANYNLLRRSKTDIKYVNKQTRPNKQHKAKTLPRNL